MTRAHSSLLLLALGGLVALGGFLLVTRGGASPLDGVSRTVAEAGGGSGQDGPDPDLVPIADDEAERVEASGAVEGGDGSEGAAPAPRPASLEGVVALPPGFPAQATVRVRAWPAAGGDVAPAFLDLAPGTTRWRFDGLAPGAWVVSARADAASRIGPRIGWGRAEPADLLPGEDRAGVRVALQEYVVTGTVTDAHGAPLAGIHVDHIWSSTDPQAGDAREAAPEVQTWGSTVSDGRVILNLSGLDGGVFRIQPPLQEAEVAEVEELLDALSRAQEAAAVSGTRNVTFESYSVSAANVGFGGESIRLSDHVVEESGKRPATPDGWVLEGFRADHVVTDAAGVFRIPLPGPGDVELMAPGSEQPEAAVSYLRAQRALSVSVDEPTVTVTLELQPAAILTGRLTRSDGSTDGIEVFLRALSGGGTRNESTDGEGRYRFDGLPPGEYLFYARSGGERGQDLCTHDRILFEDGGTYVHDDVLTASSSVEGRLVDEAGEPLEGLQVIARGKDNHSLSRNAETGPDGRFRITGMYPCDHVLSVPGHELEGTTTVQVPPRGALVDAGTLIGRASKPLVR